MLSLTAQKPEEKQRKFWIRRSKLISCVVLNTVKAFIFSSHKEGSKSKNFTSFLSIPFLIHQKNQLKVQRNNY